MTHPTYGGGPGGYLLERRQEDAEQIKRLRGELASLRRSIAAARQEINRHAVFAWAAAEPEEADRVQLIQDTTDFAISVLDERCGANQ